MPLAENALTTVDKIRLPIDPVEIEPLINTASDIIERHCNTKFNKKQRTKLFRPVGQMYLTVPFWNLETVSQILHDGEEITEYTVLQEEGMIYKNDHWPDSRDYDLEITLTAGFTLPKDDGDSTPRDLPRGIEHACILLTSQLHYQMKRDLSVSDRSLPDVSESYFKNEGKLPGAVRNLLSPWRVSPV